MAHHTMLVYSIKYGIYGLQFLFKIFLIWCDLIKYIQNNTFLILVCWSGLKIFAIRVQHKTGKTK
jgi:hypothetical protein